MAMAVAVAFSWACLNSQLCLDIERPGVRLHHCRFAGSECFMLGSLNASVVELMNFLRLKHVHTWILGKSHNTAQHPTDPHKAISYISCGGDAGLNS